MRRTAVIFLAASLCAAPVWAEQTSTQGPPVIVTQGEAVLKRAPERAFVTIAAEARAATPSDAQRQSAEASRSVQAALSKLGIPAAAIRTTSYSLLPDIEYTNGRSRVRGYIARNQIEVTVDDLDKLGGVIDAVGTAGATSVSNIQFDVRNRPAAEREALKLAVQDAMARARAIAEGAAVTLGPIVRIDASADGPRPMPMPMFRTMTASAGADAPTPITPGELEIRATVTVTVAIK